MRRTTLGPETAEVKAFFQSKGGSPNGGTLATALYTWDAGAVEKMRDPFLLIPGAKRTPRPIERDPRGAHFDADIGAWVTPWVMGAIDTRVVRRSCAILNRDLAYQEYMKFDGKNARLQATAFAVLSGFAERAMKFQNVRHLMRRIGPRPGTEPSEEAMDAGWFRCELFASTRDGRTARALVAGQGDPANRVTVKCLCEAALSLASQHPALPSRAGVLTPSTALGDALIARLNERGIQFTIVIT